jgi:hypothetical protein
MGAHPVENRRLEFIVAEIGDGERHEAFGDPRRRRHLGEVEPGRQVEYGTVGAACEGSPLGDDPHGLDDGR